MAYLFTSNPPSYAEERLSSHLSSLSTLPVHLPPQSQSFTSQSSRPNPTLQLALHTLSASKPLTPDKVIEVLQSLSRGKDQNVAAYTTDSDVDKLVEAEVLSRAVTMVWKEVMQALLDGALKLEEERSWWDASLNSNRGVGLYLLQSKSNLGKVQCLYQL